MNFMNYLKNKRQVPGELTTLLGLCGQLRPLVFVPAHTCLKTIISYKLHKKSIINVKKLVKQ